MIAHWFQDMHVWNGCFLKLLISIKVVGKSLGLLQNFRERKNIQDDFRFLMNEILSGHEILSRKDLFNSNYLHSIVGFVFIFF